MLDALADSAVDARQVSLFAVGSGPGAFTGLRVGDRNDQGLAFARDHPVIGMSAFDAIAVARGRVDAATSSSRFDGSRARKCSRRCTSSNRRPSSGALHGRSSAVGAPAACCADGPRAVAVAPSCWLGEGAALSRRAKRAQPTATTTDRRARAAARARRTSRRARFPARAALGRHMRCDPCTSAGPMRSWRATRRDRCDAMTSSASISTGVERLPGRCRPRRRPRRGATVVQPPVDARDGPVRVPQPSITSHCTSCARRTRWPATAPPGCVLDEVHINNVGRPARNAARRGLGRVSA